MRYHKDNDFKFEAVYHDINEIQQRHRNFLDTYFDVILEKCRTILTEYLVEISNVEAVMEKDDFQTVLKVASLHFESIFESDYIYDRVSLARVYGMRDEHFRYRNQIDLFYKDLRSSLSETKSYIAELFEPTPKLKRKSRIPKITIEFVDTGNVADVVGQPATKESFHYELGKLATKINHRDFQFFGGMLRARCEGNEPVLAELDHMERNLGNAVEYHCALRLIEAYLGKV